MNMNYLYEFKVFSAFLPKKENKQAPEITMLCVCVCVCVCVCTHARPHLCIFIHFNSLNMQLIFTRPNVNVIPLVNTPMLYFSISCSQY